MTEKLNTEPLTSEQREILELLCAELSEIMTLDTCALFSHDQDNSQGEEDFLFADDLDDRGSNIHRELAQLEFGDDALVAFEDTFADAFEKKDTTQINQNGAAENPSSSTAQARHELIGEYTQCIEQLCGAMELAGLSGLLQCCQQLAKNFQALVDGNHNPANDFTEQLASWPLFVLNYLHELLENSDCDQTNLHNAGNELLEYISDGSWPLILSAQERADIEANLFDIKLIDTSADDNSLPDLDAGANSLDIDSDVRTELLQGLMLELPGQSRTYEKSVTAFINSRETKDLAPAQRIAHTIKGSANIVGIKGLANLMHLSEDLLEIVAKQEQLPKPLDEVLIDTADCLGDIVDFLTNHAPKPLTLSALLKNLLDSVRALKEGEEIHYEAELADSAEATAIAEEIDTPNHVDVEHPTDNTVVAATEYAEEDHDQTIAVPARSAQQLLRIAGEFQITNTQVMAQLEAMQTSMKQTESYHRRIKSMAMELEALLQTQSALRAAVYRSHTKEHDADENASNSISTEFDPLEMESYSELHSFSNQLLELTADSFEAVSYIGQQIDELYEIAYAQKQLNYDNNDLLLKAHMVTVDTIVSRLQRCVRQVCRLTGKHAELIVAGDQLLVDGRVLNKVVDPLMHLLRNAVDHGIEDTATRLHADKPEHGTILVTFLQRGELLTISIADDGQGLDYEQIKAKAIQKSLITPTQAADEAQLSRLLFMPGFSTRDTANQTSGRGIGLDVVATEVKNLKGEVQLESKSGQGCQFVLSVPASILSAHALLVSNGKSQGTFSVLSRGIEQIIHVTDDALVKTTDGLRFALDEEQVPVYRLQDLAAVDMQKLENTITALLIVRRHDQSKVAIAVSNISASQDLVIKPLNRFTFHPPGVVGATILGDGTVSPVINLQDLPGFNLSAQDYAELQKQRDTLAAQQNAQDLQLPTALIIDDSYSARQSLSQFVRELGMRVKTAKDGFEAISVMQETKPSVILVDLEMPRMNGLEFTSHIRANPDFEKTPVIMITSRSTDKHRALAQKAGVNTYLNKPWSDEELLTSIQQQLVS